jgi:hypothetical protein
LLERISCPTLFVAIKFKKLKIILFLKRNITHLSELTKSSGFLKPKNYMKNSYYALRNTGLRSGIRKLNSYRIPDEGVKKHRIRYTVKMVL